MNLLEKTAEILRENGKSLKDIEWIGCCEFTVSIQGFLNKVSELENCRNVLETFPEDIVVVGNDFWLERDPSFWGEFEGRTDQCWIFRSKPIKPNIQKELRTLSFDDLASSKKRKCGDIQSGYFEIRLEHLTK
ncbi:MAG: hypothetical protein LUI06_04820 [Ruminococcus sp.]|nr:hypothetical protein [Ruminococcus sp.]